MKASNIYQKLKSAGIGNPDGVSSKPLIKGVGIKSPLNMGKQSPMKRGGSSFQSVSSGGKGGMYSAFGGGKDSDSPKPYVKKGGKATGKMKDYALGSEARKAGYDARGWKYDDTIKGYDKKGNKIKSDTKVSGVKPEKKVNVSKSASTKINAEIAKTKVPEVPKANTSTEDAPKSKKTVRAENKVNRLESRKSNPRRERRIAKQKAKLEGKSRKEIKAAKLKAKSEATLGKIGEQAKKGEGQNKAKVERLQGKLKRQIARGKKAKGKVEEKSPAEMNKKSAMKMGKKSAMKMAKKSPAKMAKSPNKFNKGLKKAAADGKLDNNPKFKAAVENSPAKMMGPGLGQKKGKKKSPNKLYKKK